MQAFVVPAGGDTPVADRGKYIAITADEYQRLRVSEPSLGSATSITADDAGSVTAGRYFAVICTAAGNVKVRLETGDLFTFPVETGLSMLPFRVTRVYTTDTTATATYYNMQ